jgi:DNA-binding CsgD family transcriptional regulator
MDRKKKINAIAIPSIGKTVRYIEWIAIATSAIAILVNGILLADQPHLPGVFPNLVVLILVLCLTPLSSIFPIDRPLWQKRIYILLELVLILPTRLSDVNLELILFLIFAKASLLLNRKDVITIVVLAGIVWLSIPIWLLTLPEVIEFINSQRPSPTSSNNLILQYIINDFSVYLAASTFVILLSFVIVSERRSREKAIALAQEIDYLSAALERSRIARNIHDHLGHTLINPPVLSKQKDEQHLFSDRELEILKLLGKGQNNREIAQTLHLTEGTIKNYITNIFCQLGVRDRTQAALWAKQNLF